MCAPVQHLNFAFCVCVPCAIQINLPRLALLFLDSLLQTHHVFMLSAASEWNDEMGTHRLCMNSQLNLCRIIFTLTVCAVCVTCLAC